ncbi:MAG: hypothetical protein KKA28_09815, partial [Planctomycetes bacterium]|nr:hypothetical protein [Planctomycetota bacterium]MCG2684052.1 hypothetical protein [Planctomycetales bacterium]
KPYANTSCEPNYRLLPQTGCCHEKSFAWLNASWRWPLDIAHNSESADQLSVISCQFSVLARPQFIRGNIGN